LRNDRRPRTSDLLPETGIRVGGHGELGMRGRAPFALAFAAVMPVLPAGAQSQEEQALALLRASSAQSAIITFCGKHYAIDGTTALRISQTARDVATKVLGPDRANAAFRDELARRFAEVRDVGEQQWCTDQRDQLAGGEVRIFKD
jgi:hypothetical protein